MKRPPRIPFFLFAFALSLISAIQPTAAQTPNRNNPYSPSPATTKIGGEPIAVVDPPAPQLAANISRSSVVVAPKAIEKIATRSSKPTDVYRIGAGDVLFVDLKNAANGSGYYTVGSDGTINYPLAGERVVVASQTTDEIESMLASTITIYKDAAVEVKVRDRQSHKITVTGLVEQNGDRTIQRDAVPLFVVKADVGVQRDATAVSIRRATNNAQESYLLNETKTDDVLIYPGDSLEFTSKLTQAKVTTGFFYVSGEIVEAGQHDLSAGMTLMGALNASGGAKGNPKKALIHRKGDKGTLNVLEFNIRAIKDGKASDPLLVPGDLIEIIN